MVAIEMKTQHLPGMAVALAKQGTIIYAQGYGYAETSDCLPVQATTQFRIGSVTKTFTAAAALQLQSTGALNIDKPVMTYLPSYPFDPRITVRMLLEMASGLVDYVNDRSALGPSDSEGASEQAILMAIARGALQFTPGSQYQYSNSNYYVLGAIIEVVSSESYSDYLTANVIKPLGLDHTSFTQPSGAALPITTRGEQLLPPAQAASFLFAAGQLWSDVLDLATFDAGLFGGRVVPPAQLTEMATPSSASGWTMGQSEQPFLNRPLVFKAGAVTTCLNGACAASYAWNAFFIDDGFSISLLTNGQPTSANGFGLFGADVIAQVCSSWPTQC